MRHIILLFLCCCAIIVSVASFFPSAVCNVPDFSQNNPSLFRDSGRREVVPVSNVSRFCNVMNMRRPGGGGGRLKKQKSGPSKMRIAGIDVSVTNVLIAVNLAVFLALKKYPRLANRFMKYDRAIAAGQRYRLFTSVFLHKALYHVGANSYSLYQIGPMADIIFGPSRFFCTYLFSGVFANVLTYMFKSSPASLGASGCTFGIIGAFATHFYRNRAILGKAQSDSALSNIKRTVFINLMYGFSMPNVDNGAHIGGFLAGALFAYLFGPRYLYATQSTGRKILTDRPLVPYTKYWKLLKPTFSSENTGTKNVASLNSGYTEEINFNDDLYSADDDFSSDSSGMRGGQGVKFI